MTDRDDVETENNFMQKIEEILLRHQVLMSQEFTGNEWNSGTLKNARNDQNAFENFNVLGYSL